MARRAAELLGIQTPTHRIAPVGEYSRGPEAIELAEMAGLTLDQYQRDLLIDGCMVTGDRWTSPEVGIELSRQNGKSVIFYARSLAGLFLFGSRLIVYTAHKGETAMEAFGIIDDLIGGTPELKREVARVSRTNGKEFIKLHTGQRIKFRTRTSGGGRGLSGDDVIVDEAQDADDDDMAALLPTTMARPNSQIWYGGSAGGQSSTVQGRLVKRCTDGSPGLVYYRFAASEDDDPAAPETLAKTNPALGRRILLEKLLMAQRSLAVDKFAAEHLGIGDYPRAEGEDWVIPRSAWERALDEQSRPIGPVVFSVDVKPNRDWGSIGVAGRRRDGHRHGEVIEQSRGTRWITPRLVRLTAKNPHLGVIIDPAGPAGSLIGEIEDAGIKVTTTTAQEMARACGELYDRVTAQAPCPGDGTCARLAAETPCPGREHTCPWPEFHHRGSAVLTSALASASTRKLGDAWAFRRHGIADISPIVSVALANYGLTMLAAPPKPPARPQSAVRRPGDRRDPDLAKVSF